MLAKKQSIKKAGATFVFYAVAVLSIYLLERFSPSGPCTPGLGILSLMLLPVLSTALFLKNLYRTLKGSQSDVAPMAIHLLALAMAVAYISLA